MSSEVVDYKGKRRPFSPIDAFRQYVDKICGISGMKALLVDEETMITLSLVVSQTTIIGKQTFFVERLDSPKAKSKAMNHLKAVCLLRPTKKTLSALHKSLRDPKYKEYHIFFTNFAQK